MERLLSVLRLSIVSPYGFFFIWISIISDEIFKFSEELWLSLSLKFSSYLSVVNWSNLGPKNSCKAHYDLTLYKSEIFLTEWFLVVLGGLEGAIGNPEDVYMVIIA